MNTFSLTAAVSIALATGKLAGPVAAGVMFLVLNLAGGYVSGNHLNPAVTLGAFQGAVTIVALHRTALRRHPQSSPHLSDPIDNDDKHNRPLPPQERQPQPRRRLRHGPGNPPTLVNDHDTPPPPNPPAPTHNNPSHHPSQRP